MNKSNCKTKHLLFLEFILRDNKDIGKTFQLVVCYWLYLDCNKERVDDKQVN